MPTRPSLPIRLWLTAGALLLIVLASCTTRARSQAPTTPPGPGVTPADRLGEGWWAERHQAMLAAAKAHPDTQLLLIGDSITNNYEKANPPDENFQPTWREFYEPRRALNLGFSGDTTANVLRRLDHGEVEGLHPKVALLLIGTNNTGVGNQTAEQTEAGVAAVVADLEQRLPQTRILLLSILPSDISDSKTARDRAINDFMAQRYGLDARVRYLDISSVFLKNGAVDASMYYDPRLPQHGRPLHPDTNGQHRMAEAIEPTLAALMSEAPRVPLAAMTEVNTAVIPVPRLELDSYDWYARHAAELRLQELLAPQVVMIGDSITHFWAGQPVESRAAGPLAWKQLFGTAPVLNMGFGWDRTQNVLWRLQQGEFEGIHPRWVVLEIGTNNLTGTAAARASTPAEVVAGVDAICKLVHARSAGSRLIVMGIFPRGPGPDAPLRSAINETNRLLAAHFAGDASVSWLDVGNRFLTPDGMLPARLMPDGTHPSEAGYAIWAQALAEAGVKP